MKQVSLESLLTNNEFKTIIAVADDVRKRQIGESSGHDWDHTLRVWNLTVLLSVREGADTYISSLAALVHDVADWKLFEGTEVERERETERVLAVHGVEPTVIVQVCKIVDDLSFLGGGVARPMDTVEGKCVQDADRLDAIGALGIARCFAYGGSRGREIFSATWEPRQDLTEAEYKTRTSDSISHFYEKLLLLKPLMNTQAAREMAETRHQMMEQFLNAFHREWDEDHSVINID